MRAVAVTHVDRLAVVDVPAPISHDEDILVAIDSSGICGTDLKILHGDIPVAFPRVLGHEVVGRVLGANASGRVPEGTRVLIDPYSSCGSCRLCLSGQEQLCRNGTLMGRDVDGGLTELVAVDESRLHVIPEAVDDHSAALLQVLGTCVHAQERITAQPTDVAVVIGLGVSGLLHVQLLRERGVEQVIGITRSASKRALAESLGATATAAPDDAADLVASLTDHYGADIVIECAGTAATLTQAITLAAPGGTVVLFGITSKAPELPLYQLYFNELTLIGARAARSADYAKGIELAAADRIQLAPLWTANFSLADADRALARVAESDALKVTLSVR